MSGWGSFGNLDRDMSTCMKRNTSCKTTNQLRLMQKTVPIVAKKANCMVSMIGTDRGVLQSRAGFTWH